MAEKYANLLITDTTRNWNGSAMWFLADRVTPTTDPTSADNVHFDNLTFLAAGQSVVVNSSASCLSMDWTGATNTPTLAFGSQVLNVAGNCTFIAGMGIAANTGTLNVTGTGNLTTASLNFNGLTINLNGTAHTLSGSPTGILTLRRTGTATKTDTVTFTSGTTVTATNFSMIGNSATNRLLAQSSTLGTAATITATNQAFSNVDFMDITLTTAYSYNQNILVNGDMETGSPPAYWLNDGSCTFTADGVVFHSGNQSAKLVNTGGNPYIRQVSPLSGALYLNMHLAVSAYTKTATAGKYRVAIYYDGGSGGGAFSSWHTGDNTWQNLTVNGVTTDQSGLHVGLEGISNGVGEIVNYDDAVCYITDTIGDCGGNTGITFPSGVPQTWDGTTDSWSNAAKWTSRVPLPQDDVSAGGAANTITVDMPRIGRSVTFTGTPTVTTALSQVEVYGSVTLCTGMTNSLLEIWCNGRGNYTLTSSGLTAKFVLKKCIGGVYTLQDAFTPGTGSSWTIEQGTLNTNGKSVTARRLVANAGSLILGNSTITLLSTLAEIVWTVGTLNAGTSTIILTNSGANDQTFAGGGLTYNNVTVQGAGAYALTITGNNTFNTFTVDASQANKTIVATGTTQTYNRLLRDRSTNAITMTGGNWVSNLHYQTVLDYMVMTNVVSLSPQTLYVGRHSTNGGGNVYVYFTDIPISNSMLRIGGRIVCL